MGEYTAVDARDRTEVKTELEANLIGSLMEAEPPDRPDWETMHLPVIDIDYQAHLVPSRTPGHYHLYLERPISWGKYKNVLRALADAGLIERGYCEASISAKQSFARVPSANDRWKELLTSEEPPKEQEKHG